MIEIMFWPLMASILLPGLLVYLGLHVLKREIIFIDIAMAQMASLGVCVAIMFHLDLKAPETFLISLGFTIIGAAIFSGMKKDESEIPLEAIIGIVYVMAAAAAVILLSRAAEGDEQIKNMLVGNILLVTPSEVWKTFGLFSFVGLIHWIFRKNFLAVTFGEGKERLCSRCWDFLFYALFGLVATSFVRIAGVLLVFTYLIVPATCGIRIGNSFTSRMFIGWAISLIGGIVGLWISFYFDLPSGAAIVCTFGVLMFIAFAVSGMMKRKIG